MYFLTPHHGMLIQFIADSCTNVRIEDSYRVSGDDYIAVKSGWDEYGISFGMPTKQLVIRRLTCISPYSATTALGSKMSSRIQNVRAEDIYVKRSSLHTIKWVLWMSGNYKHADNHYDSNALPVIQGISYKRRPITCRWRPDWKASRVIHLLKSA
ncbi:hypothetical protein PVK06_023933 [Gossypium arboreum]|uniref:Uncharacterized protein n=1 Tax=Gossypium arboreum TaxID=29729 RepID=A0ABR0PCI6_GOSAR|nr:hypothetical protein PVK06_023933 [Gossypium arboreum]